MLVAVTVYVKDPVLDVSSIPGEPDPLTSVHAAIPGPPTDSAQENCVATTCPTV